MDLDLETFLTTQLTDGPATVRRDVPTDLGRLDYVIETRDCVYIVGVTAHPPEWEAVARLEYYLQHREILTGYSPNADLQAVLAAPAFSAAVRRLAARSNILLLTVPLGSVPPRIGHADLTTPRAWDVVMAVLRTPKSPGVRQLSRLSGSSPGWASVILRTLQAKGITEPDGSLSAAAIPRLLDHVATYRPLTRREKLRFDSGCKTWDELMLTMAAQWPHLNERLEPPGVWVCAQTAAIAYSGHSLRHDRFQIYTEDPAGVRRFFERQNDGIPIVVYAPDRDLGARSSVKEGLPTVGVEQAILDVAGMGATARDVAIKLVEGYIAEHQRDQ